jgi:hypothetical protein
MKAIYELYDTKIVHADFIPYSILECSHMDYHFVAQKFCDLQRNNPCSQITCEK